MILKEKEVRLKLEDFRKMVDINGFLFIKKLVEELEPK